MRTDNFVIGYKSQGNCIYGKDIKNESSFTDPMTLEQAKKAVKKLVTYNCGKISHGVIYKLVEVKK